MPHPSIAAAIIIFLYSTGHHLQPPPNLRAHLMSVTKKKKINYKQM